MKKAILLLVVFASFTGTVLAQDEEREDKPAFKENLFVGGSATVSFFSGGSILGISPLVGHRFLKFMDGGLAFNLIYSGQRDYQEFDDKVRQTVYGGGVFTRIYPVNFLFLQAQLEHNFIKLRYKPATSVYQPFTETSDATSLLLGGGYCQGRGPGSNTFYYVSVLFDVLKNENSPYTNLAYNPSTGQVSVRVVPVVRAGINIGLFEGRNRNR